MACRHFRAHSTLMKFIALNAVVQALKERRFWFFCAAMATDRPLAAGPNLRRLA